MKIPQFLSKDHENITVFIKKIARKTQFPSKDRNKNTVFVKRSQKYNYFCEKITRKP